MSCSPQALSAFHTLVQVDDGLGTFTTIAELTSITGPSMNAEVIDVTTHNCDEPFRQFISGLIDPGEMSLEVNMIPTDATHNSSTGLVYLLKDRVRRDFKVIWPDEPGSFWTFPGVVTQFQPSSNPAEALKASVSIKVTGAPTFSDAG